MAFLATENASSSSSSIPPSSTPGSKYEHDVFLSFRGPDTRNNFTDHLYDRLKQEGISTFRDDKRLEQGTKIDSGLLEAIDESKIAVVVLSKQYASSSWCLIELAKIVECMDKKKLTVLPVFHYVDPSDVRYQRGSFAEAFAEHENRFKDDDVKTWRAALTKVAYLSGWHLKDISESEVIKKIIQRISSELDREVPFVSEHLVGMDSRVKEMLDLCSGERLNCVRLVGICGMGGIGKTTLAREIYNRIFRNFDASSFIANVREESKSRHLVSLQNNLLSKILMGTEKNISDVEEGKKILRNRLCKKKVLIVLDDVNDDEQLKALAGKDWFGLGSIIIATSRDSHLLKTYWDGVIDIYIAKELNYDQAMELFSLKAFKKPHPEENYVDLSINFVNYAKGLPLALRVLGSSLFGKTLDVWRSARDKLEAKPNRDIMDVLELSVDGLDDTQRDLFLDIAFLFKNMDSYYIRDTLESLGHHAYDIDVLQDKSLITIASYGALWMHDLLKEMGREIVRRESPEEPGKRSRLWSYNDVLHVLKTNTGTEVVKGIMLNMPIEAKERLSAEAFSKMKILRFLKIGYVHPPQDHIRGPIQLPQGLSYLSNELRIIDWRGYPLKSLPTSFQPNKLVELIMRYSDIKQLWKGIMILNELKLIDLSDSKNLIEIPNLSGAPNLKTLNLSGCSKLNELPENLGKIEGLEKLDLSGTAITGLPSSIIHLKNLKGLSLSRCVRLSSRAALTEVANLSGWHLEDNSASTKWKRLYLKIVESEIKEAESLPSELLAGPSERNKLYFFFWHAYSPVMYSLYEVDVPIPLPPPPSKADQDDRISNPKSLSPILQLKTGKYADGMCCVQLGSILYFLGGEMNIDNPYIDEDVKKGLKNVEPDVLPKVVYMFDLAIDREVKDNDNLLTGTPMNYGKASPLAFVADEKIYVIGSTIRDIEVNRIPYFEMFDPKVDKWFVLEIPPEINVNTIWVGHAVVGRKALLVGWRQNKKHLYCFDLDTCEWASISIPDYAGNFSGNTEFVGNTFYGCYYDTVAAIAPLVGEEKDELKEEEEEQEQAEEKDFQQMFKHHRLLQVSEDLGMDAILNVPPQLQYSSSLLHLGKMYFCYVRTGMPPHPDPILANDLVIGDDKKRFISIVIFQAIGKTCDSRFFRAKFLHSEHYVVDSPFPNDGFIRGCYVFGSGSTESSKQISI